MSSSLIHRLEPTWLAASKPVGIAAIPERSGDADCLQARLERETGGRLWVVHRLDKEVSGLILFARTAPAHRHLSMAFEHHKVDKAYQAGVHGEVVGEEGKIDLALREFGSGRTAPDPVNGKPCLTLWKVLERRPGKTLCEVNPRTGRRHQIRAHFYALGHPLIGDPRYGVRADQAAFPRLLLHAWRLRFQDESGREVSLELPPDETFQAVWKS